MIIKRRKEQKQVSLEIKHRSVCLLRTVQDLNTLKNGHEYCQKRKQNESFQKTSFSFSKNFIFFKIKNRGGG